jgi:hypothetical protein
LILALILTAVLALVLAACGQSGLADAIAEYSDSPITIVGLLAEEFTVTPGDLAALECVSRSAAGQTDKGGKVAGIGPTLTTFLAEYGKTPADFTLVRFIASDAYRITLRQKTLTERDIVLSLANGEDPLPGSQRPMRLVIPGAESSQWIYAVERIEFEY